VVPNPIARLDGRTRILLVLLLAITIVALNSLPSAGVAVLIAVGLLALSRPEPKGLSKRILAMEGILLGLLVTLPWVVPGTTLVQIGPLSASVEGLEQGGLLFLRANAVALTVFALLGRMDVTEVGAALAQLRVPVLLIQTLLFATRYVGVLSREAERGRDALRVRGFSPGTNVLTYQATGWWVGNLVLGSLDRAERALDAMKCRGFDGTFPSPNPTPSLPSLDRAVLAAVAVLALFASIRGPLGLWV